MQEEFHRCFIDIADGDTEVLADRIVMNRIVTRHGGVVDRFGFEVQIIIFERENKSTARSLDSIESSSVVLTVVVHRQTASEHSLEDLKRLMIIGNVARDYTAGIIVVVFVENVNSADF